MIVNLVGKSEFDNYRVFVLVICLSMKEPRINRTTLQRIWLHPKRAPRCNQRRLKGIFFVGCLSIQDDQNEPVNTGFVLSFYRFGWQWLMIDF